MNEAVDGGLIEIRKNLTKGMLVSLDVPTRRGKKHSGDNCMGPGQARGKNNRCE